MRRCLKVRANCSSSSRSLGSSPMWPPWPPWPPELKPEAKEEAMALLDAEVTPTDVTTPTPLLPVATKEPPLLLLPASLLFSLCDVSRSETKSICMIHSNILHVLVKKSSHTFSWETCTFIFYELKKKLNKGHRLENMLRKIKHTLVAITRPFTLKRREEKKHYLEFWNSVCAWLSTKRSYILPVKALALQAAGVLANWRDIMHDICCYAAHLHSHLLCLTRLHHNLIKNL